MNIERAPSAQTAMLIRKPVAEVFQAFVDPAITSQFWFTKRQRKTGSGKTDPMGLGDVWSFGTG